MRGRSGGRTSTASAKVTWKLDLAPGKSVDLKYTWNYYWRYEASWVATTAQAVVAARPRHAEASRQIVCQGQILLVSAKAQVFMLDVLERLEELLLIVLREGLVGHREEAVVFLLDMFAEEADVTLGVRDEASNRFVLPAAAPSIASAMALTWRGLARARGASRRLARPGGKPSASIAGKRWVSSLPRWQRSAKLRKKSSACSAAVLSNRPAAAQFRAIFSRQSSTCSITRCSPLRISVGFIGRLLVRVCWFVLLNRTWRAAGGL